jgi:hypothetical protein
MKNNVCLKLFKDIPPPKKENTKKYEVRYYTLVEGEYQYILKSDGEGKLYKLPQGNSVGEDVLSRNLKERSE